MNVLADMMRAKGYEVNCLSVNTGAKCGSGKLTSWTLPLSVAQRFRRDTLGACSAC